MREILFRGKRIDNGEWVYGDIIHRRYYKNTDVVVIRTEDSGFDNYSDYEVDPDTVGQFTGLTDKNGKKIFEGDIVKTKFGRICKVIFFQSPCYCGIDLIPLEDKHKCPDKFDLYLSDNLEIIGNIYDNPELLDGWWEIDKGFETLNETIEYAKQCQSNGYVIIDIQIRDFEVSE